MNPHCLWPWAIGKAPSMSCRFTVSSRTPILVILPKTPTPSLNNTSCALALKQISVERHGRVKERIYRMATRLVIMGVVGGIACLVPFFDSFLSLLGALGNCMLIYVLPIAFYWRLIGWRQMRWYELVWCATILIIGLLGCVIGSIDAIESLHRDFTQGRS
ncbi:hypothetical protein EDD21DRAFT_390180 [Dissophora ornata]|nr:hypothetical protein EDD21DRAFT_390180 [Dissophora ornata]